MNRKIRENLWWRICHLPLMKICTSRGRHGWRSGSILIGIALLNASISYMHWHVSNYLHSSRRILFRCVDLGAQFSFQPFLQIILGMKLKVQFVLEFLKSWTFWGVRYLMCNITIFFSFYVTLKRIRLTLQHKSNLKTFKIWCYEMLKSYQLNFLWADKVE